MKNIFTKDIDCKKSQQKVKVKQGDKLERNSNLPKKKRDSQYFSVAAIIPVSDSSLQVRNGINNGKQPSHEFLEPNNYSSERESLTSEEEKEQETRDEKAKSASKICCNLDEKSSNDGEDSRKMSDRLEGEVNRVYREKYPGTGICGRPEGNDGFSCGQCGKTFKTKYTLSIHQKMPNHTEKRPFVCNVCGKGFRLSSTLCRHKIIHTDKKPYGCPQCEKSFNRSSTLKTHMRTHNEHKAFVCEVCGKGFHQKGNLRNHVFVHTGEKPFKCSECDRAFNKMSNLKFHMHTHSGNMPYYCKICRKRFLRKTELKQHVKDLHS